MNDVLAQGAKPLFMLDYLAVDKMRPEVVATLVKGVAQATKTIGASLIGGESAELPGMYAKIIMILQVLALASSNEMPCFQLKMLRPVMF
ncbi:Phosphoribosylformylglycinamidine cyclo-ligase [Weissella viridescens]|uniref:Phosphoribosylformylglycinamidine cyclo-ligase n=1 Tax=Weissella viridescens TaxID=1629 RepID=A0A380P0U9_WEIVI|nr:Phosphoribosylformylglycinamidine cyclo-ligase [Weissella viridescens]